MSVWHRPSAEYISIIIEISLFGFSLIGNFSGMSDSELGSKPSFVCGIMGIHC